MDEFAAHDELLLWGVLRFGLSPVVSEVLAMMVVFVPCLIVGVWLCFVLVGVFGASFVRVLSFWTCSLGSCDFLVYG